jgi:hypothetical protein
LVSPFAAEGESGKTEATGAPGVTIFGAEGDSGKTEAVGSTGITTATGDSGITTVEDDGMPADSFTIKQGDTQPPLIRDLKNADGSAIDLTGATVVFTMKRRSTVKINEQACSILSPESDGSVQYDWQTADTDTAGVYQSEFECTLPGGEIITVPNDTHMEVHVVAELA